MVPRGFNGVTFEFNFNIMSKQWVQVASDYIANALSRIKSIKNKQTNPCPNYNSKAKLNQFMSKAK